MESLEDWPISSDEIKPAMDMLVSAMAKGDTSDLEPMEIDIIVDAMGHMLCGDAIDSIRSIAIAADEIPEMLVAASTQTAEKDVLVRRLNILARRDLALRVFGREARQRILALLSSPAAEDAKSE